MNILERLQHKYLGKYRGAVTDVDAATMRIKAKVPAVLGTQASGWALPCVPYAGKDVGIAFLPEVGSGVWIEFEGGDVSMPIWTGCYWHDGEYPADAKADVKVIVTASKHKLILDDANSVITISDDAGNKITLDSSGVQIERGGQKVLVSSAKVDVNSGALEVV
ncbi:MAG: phage baseplate assembly protein V [Candidatus Solibacter sp.]